MKSEWVDIMKRTKRLKLSRWDTITHYSIVFFFLLFPAFTLIDLIEIYITNSYEGVRTAEELISTTWPWIIPALAFYFIQKRRLRFKEVKVNYTDKEFQEAIEKTAIEYEWKIERNENTIFHAYRPWNWTASWGEMITIIKCKDRLLLNSICDPNSMYSVASYGWNKKNIRTFLTHLFESKDDSPSKTKIDVPAREWTLKMAIIRMFTYPFCIFLIGFGIDMILNPVNWKSQGAGIGAVVIALVYLFADLKVIYKKSRTPSNY